MLIPHIQLYNGIKIIFYSKKYYSILEALEKNNIKTHAQCRGGYCGACRTLLISGNTKYIKQPLAYIQNFEILICCSIPITNIQIKT